MEEKKSKKKRSYRKAYLNDFQRNVAGEYIYTGPTHRWESPRGKSLGKLWLCAGTAFAAAVAAGCVPDCDMEQRFWALLPFMLTLILAGVQAWKLYRLTDGGDPVRDYVWKATVPQLPVLAILTATFATVAVITEAINLLFSAFSGNYAMGILYIALELLTMALSLVLRKTIQGLKWS